ncbi:MAG TPA: pyruvate dehydrogenase complex E1 component subunit beta [Candidatus Dormibacteraeota bacterium]
MSTLAEIATTKPGVQELTYREAIRLAMRHEMESDPTVLLLGEDVGDPGGPFKTDEGLIQDFGRKRVIDTPIAENGFLGVGIGLAITGFRPVIEIMFADFLLTAADALVNEAAKFRFLAGGRFEVPLTIRAIGGATGRFGAQHSQTTESWYIGVPGLKVVAASNPADAYGLLRSAIRDPNPVLFYEHKGLYVRKASVTTGAEGMVSLGKARVARSGADVTIVASLLMVERALKAADALAADGVDAEVIDLRSLAPLDMNTIAASVGRTRRLVTVEEQHRPGGWGGEVISGLVERGQEFAVPPRRLTLPDVPIPYSPPLEDAVLPGADAIADTVRQMRKG